MADEIKKSFVKKFNDFLKQQIEEQALPSDGLESLEVAIQCLEAAFELFSDESTSTETDQMAAAGAGMACGGTGSITQLTNPVGDLFELYQTAYLDTNPQRKELGENIKNDGNRLMKESKFQEALLQYNRAVTYDPTNPVFYCNRAAAFIRLGEYEKAVADCKMALIYNPDYGKAYGRMGIAYSNLNKFEEARSVYQKALELEPDNQDYQNNLRVAEERITSGNVQNIQAFIANAAAGGGGGGNGGNATSAGQAAAGPGGIRLPPNFPNIFENPSNLTDFFGDMMRDPVITSALQTLANNPEGLLDMSRQVAAAFATDNPALIRSVQETLNNSMWRGNDNDNNQDNSNKPDESSSNDRNSEGGAPN